MFSNSIMLPKWNEMKCLDVAIVMDSKLLEFFAFNSSKMLNYPQRNYYFYFLCREAVNAPSPGFLSPNYLTGTPKTWLAVILPSITLGFSFWFQTWSSAHPFLELLFHSAFLILFQGCLNWLSFFILFHSIPLSLQLIPFSLGTALHCLSEPQE